MPAKAGIHSEKFPESSVSTAQWARVAPIRRTAGTLLHFHPPWWSYPRVSRGVEGVV
jgi:hypothetical protein